MNLMECLKSAARSIVSNKMRSVLTMVGIIIGISAVITIAAAGQGVTNGITETFNSMGMNTLDIQTMQAPERERDALTAEDVDLIKQHPGVKAAAPLLWWYTSVETKNSEETQYMYMYGTSPEYLGIQNIKMLYGRFLMDSDIITNAPVAVLEENLAISIFGRSDVVGEVFKYDSWRGATEMTVIGVYESANMEGAMNFMFNMPLTGYVPHSYIAQTIGQYFLDSISIMVNDPNEMDALAVELVKMLEIKHQNKDMYYAQNSAAMLDEVNLVMASITAFIALVAGISLLVGGIGVMNIMLVTVTERTREIGIRKSLGATNNNIRVQFLIEAVIITAIGGIIGILLGYGMGFMLGKVIGVTASVPVLIVLIATAISSGIGVVFGVYPAAKAAKLDPIEALRYE